MPRPGSHKFDIVRARLRNRLDDSGVPDKRADELAKQILSDQSGRRTRLLRYLGRFARTTGR